MTLLEIDDQQIISMLPATCPEMAVKMSGTNNKRSIEYRRHMAYINRHLISMYKCRIIKWEKIRNGGKLWELC